MAASFDWPSTRWDLSAPESFALLHCPQADGRRAFKLALTELIARGALRLVDSKQKRLLRRARTTSVLTDGPKARSSSSPSLAAVWDLYRSTSGQSYPDGVYGVAVAELARAAQSTFGTLDQFPVRHVWPGLQARGLCVDESYKVLGLFPKTRRVLTASGQQARAELERWLDVGQQRFGGWVDRDPSRALAYAGMAGAALLLMDPLFPDLQLLGERMRQAGTSGESGAGGSSGWDASSSGSGGAEGGQGGLELPKIDLPGLDLGSLSFDFDFGALGDLSSSFDAIDAGVDAGGGDGGSDGGGDGGGGDGGGD